MHARHLHAWLGDLPSDVLRVKGVVRLAEEPGKWLQFQRLDESRGQAWLTALPQDPCVPACAVLIGVRLDEEAINQALKQSCQEKLPDARVA